MAITKLLGFGHLVNSNAIGAVESGYGLALSELAVTNCRHTTYAWAALLVNQGRMCYCRLASPSGSYVALGIGYIPVTSFLNGVDPTKVKRFIMGFRLEQMQAVPNPFNMGFTLETPVSDNTGNAGYITGDPIAYTIPTSAVANVQYLEFVLDLANKKLETWADGRMLTSVTVADKYITGFANLKFFMGSKGNNGASFPAGNNSDIIPLLYLDNMYALVDTGDVNDAQSGRLGNIIVDRVPVTAADGGWTPSTGTALGVINGSTTTLTNQTPNVASPGGLTPLELTLDLSAYNGRKLLGLHAAVTPFRAAADTGTIDASWVTTDGEKNKAEVAPAVPATTSTTVLPKGVVPLANPPAGAVKLRLTPR